MTITNQGNGYKFRALNKMRRNPTMVSIQGMNKNGKWGKPFLTETFGNETTAEEVAMRFEKNNNVKFRATPAEEN